MRSPLRWLIILLLLTLMGLQYRLWFGEGSLAQKTELERQLRQQQVENSRLQQRNQILAAEVAELKSGMDSVEERARTDLGMIKEGETFYMVIEEEKP